MGLENLLSGTPYLIEDGEIGYARFEHALKSAVDLRKRSALVSEQINATAENILVPYREQLRASIVSESVKIEGYEIEARQITAVQKEDRSGLVSKRRSMVDAITGDRRVAAALGLYRAYEIADEWSAESRTPLEFEVRALHAEILPRDRRGGRYKTAPNSIGLSDHNPTQPWNVSKEMAELCDWLRTGTGEPILDATIAHAWLTHIHPFDDGNGRLARLLANVALAQASFPPLLLRSSRDKEPYFAALSESDLGPIVPLYELFLKSVKRQLKLMEKPSYVEDTIRKTTLNSPDSRFKAWSDIADTFLTSLNSRLNSHDQPSQRWGMPDFESFQLLSEGQPEGNTWAILVKSQSGSNKAIVFCGYRSSDMKSALNDQSSTWPSFFVAEADNSISAPRAWLPPRSNLEVALRPMKRLPVVTRTDTGVSELNISDGVSVLVDAITKLNT